MRAHTRLLVVLLALCSALPANAAAPLTVFAAASLKEALDEAGAVYARTHGTQVRASYAASSALARQIGSGAPADVFISADTDWMDTLQAERLIDARSRADIAGNSLVLVVPTSSKAPRMLLRRGADLRPVMGREGRIAVALTASVPAGRYAKAALTSIGLWPALQPSLVEAENVRAALQLVARGEVEAGIVYASDAFAEPRVRVIATFPASTHPRIVYPAARIAASRQPRAADFVAWLRTPAAQTILRRHGFLPAR